MPRCFKTGDVVVLALLCTGIALHHDSKRSNHDTSSSDRYTAVLYELRTADKGTDVEDGKMIDLTKSIQGVFGTNFTGIPAKKELHVASTGISYSSSNGTEPTSMRLAKQTVEGGVGQMNSSVVASAKEVQDLQGNSTDLQSEVNQTIGSGKVGHDNVSANMHSVDQNEEIDNRTKAIEEAVVSLPMASLALDVPQLVSNHTEREFPGNASQKAAWEKKEQSLEKEVESLRGRLANASASMASSKVPAELAANGTLNAQFQDIAQGHTAKFMPKTELKPTSAAVITTGLHQNSSSGSPQVDVSTEHNTATSAGTQAKRKESVLAVGAGVEHDAVVVEDDGSSDSSFFWNPVSSLLSWFAQKPSLPVATKTTMPSHVVSHRGFKSLAWMKQDSERTAQAALQEHQHDFEVNDAWRQMEKEDTVTEETIRGEDVAERQRAQAVEAPHRPTRFELDGRHGTEMHGFWRDLEKEDYGIEKTVRSDDLIKYAKLTQEQDDQMAKATSQLDNSNLRMDRASLKFGSDAQAIAIHEPWLRREIKDLHVEHDIHSSPDLQMLQLQHHRKPLVMR